MIKNYFKVALRSLRKQFGYSFINIFGLAIGLTCFILIGLFVQFELSYDTFHEKADRIYRIAKEAPTKRFLGNSISTATPDPLSDALLDEFPEVEHVTQIAKANSLIEYGQNSFYEEGLYASEQFFDVFSFSLLQGDPQTALAEPNSIVITESLATRLFGTENPMGQSLTIYTLSSESNNDFKVLNVTGVARDVPANSHFTFNFLVPPSSSHELSLWFGNWNSNSYLTYASLQPDASLPNFSSKLSLLAPKHLGQLEYYQDRPNEIPTFFPQSLTDIHMHSHTSYELGTNGNIKYIYLFSAIALLILIVACINYINLATVRSTTRLMEVGVRKAMGAHRKQLIGQFMSEAILPSLIALAVAICLVILLLPAFNALTSREITLDIATKGYFLSILLLLGLGLGIIAGSYPALMISSFNPASIIKGGRQGKIKGRPLRDALIVVQFCVTIILVIGTIIIQRQLHYFENASTGFSRDQVIMIEIEDRTIFDDKYETIKQSLMSNPGVIGVTAAQTNPTDINAAGIARDWEGSENEESIQVYRSIIQHGFVDMFELELVEGRDFSEAIPVDEREGILINETLKQQLGWDTAVGKPFNFHGREARVTGVLKDYNFHSFHHEIAPLALFIDSGWWFAYQRIFVKVAPANMQETLASIEQIMKDFSPSYPFTYSFLDDAYGKMYETETRLGQIFSYFTALALLIACMGLVGLAAFTAQQRTKEIGVRKVLGASMPNILFLLSKDYTRLIIIAFIIAAPLAYIGQYRWLQEYAHHISIGWSTFLLAGVAVLTISWMTVSYQSMRVALANPVESLRHD